MCKLLRLAGAVAALAGAIAPAARADDGPTLTARVRSVNDLLGHAEYLGDVLGQGDPVKQAAQLVRGLVDPKKGLEGIDPARPIGLYGTLTPDVINSPVVLVVPIANEEAVLDLLRGRLMLDPKKDDDGLYTLRVPNVPETVYFRFAHGSAYVTARAWGPLAPKALIDPKALFAGTDDAIATVRLRLDRVPAAMRKTALGQIELQLAQRKEKPEPGETPAQAKLRGVALAALADAAAALLTDARELSVRLFADSKTDDLTAEVALTGKPGTPLAAALSTAGTGLTLDAGKTPVFAGSVRLTVPAAYREKLNAAVDDALEEAVANAKDDAKTPLEWLVDAVGPTLKSGELDLAAAVTDGDGDGKFRAVVGLRVKDGEGIEKMVKKFAPFLGDKADFAFDDATVNGVKLHKVTTTGDDLKPAFGTNTLWLGTSPDRLLLSIEPDGKAIRAAAAAKPAAVPPVAATVSFARLVAATEKGLPADTVKGLVADVYPKGPAGKDTLAVALTGGDALRLKLTLKGAAVKLAMAVDKEKKK